MNGRGSKLLMGKYPLNEKPVPRRQTSGFILRGYCLVVNPRKEQFFGQYLPSNQGWFCLLKINFFARASILFRDKGCEKHLLDKFAKEKGKFIFFCYFAQGLSCAFFPVCISKMGMSSIFLFPPNFMSLFPPFGFVQISSINLFVSLSSKQSSLFFLSNRKKSN